MSFMPDSGSRVRLKDGREATVVKIDPLGKGDAVRFDDGTEKVITAWDIAEQIDGETKQENKP